MKYRKKPVVIEAFRWTGGLDQTEEPKWIVDAIKKGDGADVGDLSSVRILGDTGNEGIKMACFTKSGVQLADIGDYIIRGLENEIYPCKPSIFEASYEKVKE